MPSKFRFAVSPLTSFASAATSFSGSSGGFCPLAAPAANPLPSIATTSSRLTCPSPHLGDTSPRILPCCPAFFALVPSFPTCMCASRIPDVTTGLFNVLPSHSNDANKVIDIRYTFVLFCRVFATRKSRPARPTPLPFLLSSHSSLFFSEVCSLFSVTVVSQLFVYQSLRHSFHRDGVCTPCLTTQLFAHPPMPFRPLPLCAPKSRRINTCKSLSKQRTLTVCRIIDLQKTGGRGVMVNQLPALASSHAGRIAKTICSRRRNDAKKSSNCFQGAYFLLSKRIPCSASVPVTISALASTQSPSSLPLAVHGAICTRGLFRMRFTFPETPTVYTKSFASLASSLTAGSAANHTGVFTPSPLFLKVSRFRYLCPANAANPIASLLAVGCEVFYAGHKKWDRHFCLSHRDSQRVQVWVASRAFGSLPDVRHVFRKSIFLFFAECPSGLEMIVVDKRVHRVMHMTVIGALQIRDAHQIEGDRLCLRRIRSAHRRL